MTRKRRTETRTEQWLTTRHPLGPPATIVRHGVNKRPNPAARNGPLMIATTSNTAARPAAIRSGPLSLPKETISCAGISFATPSALRWACSHIEADVPGAGADALDVLGEDADVLVPLLLLFPSMLGALCLSLCDVGIFRNGCSSAPLVKLKLLAQLGISLRQALDKLARCS